MSFKDVTMPPRIAKLPKDGRGYPVPSVSIADDYGNVTFTTLDNKKIREHLESELCGICGQPLNGEFAFIGSPFGAFHPQACLNDLPMHKTCAEYSLSVCPHMALKKFKGLGELGDAKLKGVVILRDEVDDDSRPNCFILGVANSFKEVFIDDKLGFAPSRPWLEWQGWRHGKKISPDEVKALALEWSQEQGFDFSMLRF